jgi:hypothetical protein
MFRVAVPALGVHAQGSAACAFVASIMLPHHHSTFDRMALWIQQLVNWNHPLSLTASQTALPKQPIPFPGRRALRVCVWTTV